MANELSGKRIAFMVANEGIEQVELTEPRKAVEEAGAETELLAPKRGEAQAFNHLDKADKFPVDRTIADASPDDYDGLVLPGGVANPDSLRTVPEAVRFIQDFVGSGKPVGAICHAPWMLVEADLVRGRRVTSWPSLKTDIRNAGGDWVDERVVVESGLITSRKPDDIPAFNEKIIEAFATSRQRAKAGVS